MAAVVICCTMLHRPASAEQSSMYRLARILRRYYPVILFVILEETAINFYAHATSYTRATLLATANHITGRVSSLFIAIGDYFSLAKTNKMLLERLAHAESQLATPYIFTYGVQSDPAYVNQIPADVTDNNINYAAVAGNNNSMQPTIAEKYHFTTARVTSNSIARQDNFFVIDKGTKEGIAENMAILAPNGGVAGYVYSCSENFAVCMSILNRRFSIGGQIKNTDFFGSAAWDGTDTREVTLTEIPRYAQVAEGDTILSAYSLRFPPGCPVGTVLSAGESPDGTTQIIRLRLTARIGALSDVLVVKYDDFDELNSLSGNLFLDHSSTQN